METTLEYIFSKFVKDFNCIHKKSSKLYLDYFNIIIDGGTYYWSKILFIDALICYKVKFEYKRRVRRYLNQHYILKNIIDELFSNNIKLHESKFNFDFIISYSNNRIIEKKNIIINKIKNIFNKDNFLIDCQEIINNIIESNNKRNMLIRNLDYLYEIIENNQV
jgi:hypothetical protein